MKIFTIPYHHTFEEKRLYLTEGEFILINNVPENHYSLMNFNFLCKVYTLTGIEIESHEQFQRARLMVIQPDFTMPANRYLIMRP